jgi:RNase P/RNase MRP subunit POP5
MKTFIIRVERDDKQRTLMAEGMPGCVTVVPLGVTGAVEAIKASIAERLGIPEDSFVVRVSVASPQPEARQE